MFSPGNSITRLPRQQPGGMPPLLRRSVANEVLSMAECLANIRVVVKQSDGTGTLNPVAAEVKFGEDSLVITLPPAIAPGASVGGVGGVNSRTANYTATGADNGKLITFSSSSALTLTLPAAPPSPVWSISVECVGLGGLTISPNSLNLDGGSGSLTLAQNQGVMIFTDGSNYFSQRGIGGAAPVSVQYYAINTLYNADYMQAFPVIMSWNAGTTSWTATLSSAVYIAKLNRMRPSVGSELIDGVTISYSSYTNDNTRTASDGTNTEYQVAFPRYTTLTTLGITDNSGGAPGSGSVFTGTKLTALINCQAFIKCCLPLGGCGIQGYTGAPIYVEEITPRVWARRYTQ